MELPRRAPGDVFLPPGSYLRLGEELRSTTWMHHWVPLLAYAFDKRTRVMPFRWLDHRVVPCGVRSLAAGLRACGFDRTRIVLQQWNPRFSVSAAVRAGQRIDLLLISSMGLHADEAYRMIRDAHTLGEQRPLIVVGGPKAIYEPEDCFGISAEQVGDGADVVVTGEEYVLLDFLRVLGSCGRPGEHPRQVFERARRIGALESVPGLVYREPDADPRQPYLVSTGVQRLLQDLDELPMPLNGYLCLEPAHRTRRILSPRPASLEHVRRKSFIASLVTTHGCRFNCDFCPIPAYQQRTWRHKSPERIAGEMKQLAEAMRFRTFFGTDDNFFNDRGSVEAIFTAMARSDVHGRTFREKIHFVTEATEFDVYKNRDLLPLAADAGLKTIYFGIEDLNAKLINKGQTISKTEDLFRELHRNEIEAYAMMIHHDDQPLWSRDPQQLGVVNQAARLFEMGAVGYHTTYITPSMGARNVETMFGSGNVFAKVGNTKVPEAYYDGNHVIASRHRRPWTRQIQLWLAFLTFYNPVNLLRTLFKDLRNRHYRRRLKWQIIGGSMIPASIAKELPYAFSLAFRRIEKHDTMPSRCFPLIDARTGERVKWGIDSEVPYEVTPGRSVRLTVDPQQGRSVLELLPVVQAD